MPELKVSLSTIVLFIALIVYCDIISTLLLVFCVLCHEAGHIIAAYILGVKIKSVRFNLFGARIELGSSLESYITELLIALSGPAASITLGTLGIIFCDGEIKLFTCINFALALVNLLPISTLDGGRIISSFASHFLGAATSDKLIRFTSAFVIVILWGISVFLWFSFEKNISLFIFCLYLFYSLIIKREY